MALARSLLPEARLVLDRHYTYGNNLGLSYGHFSGVSHLPYTVYDIETKAVEVMLAIVPSAFCFALLHIQINDD